jgi:hypothetical protein
MYKEEKKVKNMFYYIIQKNTLEIFDFFVKNNSASLLNTLLLIFKFSLIEIFNEKKDRKNNFMK